MIFFTIASRNFFSYVLTLHESLQRHHGPVKFYVAVCDDLTDFDKDQFPFTIIEIDDLGIPNLKEMSGKYNITELNTSIKPFVFLYLFDKFPEQIVTYLDPDIFVTGRFEELESAFVAGANCVLTPHVLEPAEYAEMEDRQFLRYGVYNLGFCALRDTPQVRRVASWWGRRLESLCVIDLPGGLFVDQKWADLLPAYIDHTVALRHPGYNAAYWNLSQRRIRYLDQEWVANGQPLRFFHFSGNKIEDYEVFSRHSSQFTTKNIGELNHLLSEYRDAVYRNGHEYYSRIPYAFSWNGAAGQNIHTPSAISVERMRGGEAVRPHLPVARHRSLEEFISSRAQLTSILARRREAEVSRIPFGQYAFTLDGVCSCCGHRGGFQVSGMYSSATLDDGRTYPNWREHLDCLSCRLVNRVRASLHLLQQEFKPSRNASIYITERITRTYDWLRSKYPNTVGSEYFTTGQKSGDVVEGIIHQDVQGLSFEDNVFNYILTFDVLEHVPDHAAALREFFRCLAPGGTLMITVPFQSTVYDYKIRAVLKRDGNIDHLLEPEYHGNPVDMNAGSLCFRYFGWRLLDELRTIGFEDAEVLSYWSEQLLHFGDSQLLIVARKPAEGGRDASHSIRLFADDVVAGGQPREVPPQARPATRQPNLASLFEERMTKKIENYLANGRQVEGWLNSFDASIIHKLSKHQSHLGIKGSLGEIGVHHGKLFILLKLCAGEQENTYAIDVFEEQHLNVDGSGFGNSKIFESNVLKWTGDISGLQIVKADSRIIDADTILKISGPARMLSVDGGHTEECTLSDLRLAEKLISNNGVVVLDDLFNREWPGVMAGFSQYLSAGGILKPFAVSSNKTYLAHLSEHDAYRGFGRDAGIFIPRCATVFGTEVDVWLERPYEAPTSLPETEAQEPKKVSGGLLRAFRRLSGV